MECTPEEIAEKKRIAQERLKAKKEAMAKAKESCSSEGKSNEKQQPTVALNTSNKILTNPYQNSRILSHPYHPTTSKVGNTSTNNKVNDNKQVISIPNPISCNCYMISESRFEVNPSGYNSKLIDVFRTIPSRGYGRK